MTEKFNSSEHNPLKSEHLKEGISPIMACVGTYDDFNVAATPENTHDVDFYGGEKYWEDKNFKNFGQGSHVISTVDNANKLSRAYKNCTGVIVAGQDKETGENISFLSHQFPFDFLPADEYRTRFVGNLQQQLEELKQKCIPGTIDAVVVGGNYPQEDVPDKNVKAEEYKKSYAETIKLLSNEISKTLGFEPVVITGPKMGAGSDSVLYDNKNRRLYLARAEVGNSSMEAYNPKDFELQAKKWSN
jgi:hypothetical protein